eukprot:m.186937 g.186937  ORF g.186937 m.186937 type:complete len:64 (+) comp13622_c2_seq2:4806-4997(+)
MCSTHLCDDDAAETIIIHKTLRRFAFLLLFKFISLNVFQRKMIIYLIKRRRKKLKEAVKRKEQ